MADYGFVHIATLIHYHSREKGKLGNCRERGKGISIACSCFAARGRPVCDNAELLAKTGQFFCSLMFSLSVVGLLGMAACC